MANFPFVGDYAVRVPVEIPIIPAFDKFYCQLNGKITAVKIIAWGTFGRPGKNPMSAYLLQTPCGIVEVDSWRANFFRSVEDCVKFINTNDYGLIHRLKSSSAEDVFRELGYETRGYQVYVYQWDKEHCGTWSHSTGVKVWSDVDGIHADVEMVSSAKRVLFKTSAECTAASVEVLDFDDERIPGAMGEYTIKREFTVRAGSEEDANRIVDEQIKNLLK